MRKKKIIIWEKKKKSPLVILRFFLDLWSNTLSCVETSVRERWSDFLFLFHKLIFICTSQILLLLTIKKRRKKKKTYTHTTQQFSPITILKINTFILTVLFHRILFNIQGLKSSIHILWFCNSQTLCVHSRWETRTMNVCLGSLVYNFTLVRT